MRKLLLALVLSVIACNAQQFSDAIQYVSTHGNDANDGLSWETPKLTIPAALAVLPATGGTVNIACGTFSYPTTLLVAKNGVTLRGCGYGGVGAVNGTILSPASGVVGIEITGDYVHLENFNVSGNSGVLGTDDAIFANNASSLTIRNVATNNAGRYGIHLDSSGGANTENWLIEHVVVQYSHGDGMYFGTLVNQGTCVQCNSGNSLSGWGFNVNGSHNIVFVHPYAQSNVAGGFRINTTGNRVYGLETDDGVGDSLQLTASSSLNVIDILKNAEPASIIDNGTSNMITGLSVPAGGGCTQSGMGTSGQILVSNGNGSCHWADISLLITP